MANLHLNVTNDYVEMFLTLSQECVDKRKYYCTKNSQISISFIFFRRLMFSQQAAHLFMQQPKKDDPDDRGSNPGFSPSLFSLPPHSSHLFSSHHLANVVTSQQQADFLSAISSGMKFMFQVAFQTDIGRYVFFPNEIFPNEDFPKGKSLNALIPKCINP